jgi:hypothetical protein
MLHFPTRRFTCYTCAPFLHPPCLWILCNYLYPRAGLLSSKKSATCKRAVNWMQLPVVTAPRENYERAIYQVKLLRPSFSFKMCPRNVTYSRSWALLEKLPVAQPLKNFPTFYGTRRFITVFTRALHWSLSWARSIHSISLRSILILSTHLRLGLFLLASLAVPYMHSSSPHSFYMPCPSHPPWLDHSNYVWRGVQVMKFLIMQFSPISSLHHSADQIFSLTTNCWIWISQGGDRVKYCLRCVTPYIPVQVHWRFVGTCCPNLQGQILCVKQATSKELSRIL